MDRSCIMFNCLWQLWDWLDPPVLTSSASMEDKKVPPPPQQQQGRPALSYVQHPQQPVQQCADTKYPRIVQYMLSPVEVQQEMRRPPSGPYPQSAGPRSPLLENHQELYGTKQDGELARQYALRERAQMLQRAERHQQRSYPAATPVTDPVLSAPVPPGFNASVHQAYLRRNPHQLDQIYQNHQNVYQSPTQPRAYQPYTSRIQQSNFTGSGQSHPQILKQQYDELQQMKIQQQIQYQNQAQLQQQQTFAQRQILHQHLHSRQQSQQNLSQYDSLHSMQQRDLQNMELNVRSNHKNDDYSPEDYAFNHPVAKPMQNQILQSPNYNHSANSTMNSAKSAFENSSSPSSKSPSGSESRKSSSGTAQALRSPVAQRPPSAPVTMAGWLYKQGSDGLKVWRKRWFVLSEYCLFYYKGQEEDKLLGSVLLPSYRVSGCTSEDKVLRKFAFKCEHANMRTYILAAPDREQMHQWTKALTLATLMQEGSSSNKHNQTKENHPTRNMENVTKPSNNVDQDEIAPEIVSGVQPMYENAPPKPRRSNEGYSSPSPERSMEKNDPTFDLENSSYNNNSAQKISSLKSKSSLQKENIYGSKTNNDMRNYSSQNYVSKSPEGIYNSQNLSLPLTNTATHRLERNKSPFNYQENTLNKFDRPEDRLIENKSPAYAENRNMASHNNPYHQIYPKDRQNIYEESQYHQQMQQQECNSEIIRDQFIQDQDFGHGYQQYHISTGLEKQTFERRTPDTYGRSVVVPGYYNKGRSGDYEDVYNNLSSGVDDPNYGEITYRRPLSPMSYERRKISSMQNQQRYGSTNMENNQQPRPSSSVQVRQKKIPHDLSIPTLAPNSVPRPHSADFLEYESKNPVFDSNSRKQNSNNFSRQPPRPKSSLDINHGDYNGDNYYYSEASYAEKMRQSAQYLRNKGSGTNMLNVRHSSTNPPEYMSQRKMSAPTFNVSEGIIDSNYDHNVRLNGEPVYGMHDQNKNVNTDNKYSLNEISGPNSNWTLRNKNLSQLVNQDDIYNRSNSAMSETSLSTSGGLTKDQIVENSGEQFIRSASARLPTNNDQISPREGERKVQQREESMKRLLEWKQRMLQSPLTRKSTPATLSLARSLNQTKSIHPTGERYLATSGGQTFPKSHSRTYNQHQTAYNSYSSDDEVSSERLADVVRDEPSTSTRQGQAGRSPTPSPPPTPTVLSKVTHPHVSVNETTLLHKPPHDIQPLIQTSQSNSFILNQSEKDRQSNNSESLDKPLSVVCDISTATKETDEDSKTMLEYTDEDLDEVLALYDDEDVTQESQNMDMLKSDSTLHKEDSIYAKNIDSNSTTDIFPDYEICEINQSLKPSHEENESIIPTIKIRSKANTPVSTTPNPDICEDHYLPMSPRKEVRNTKKSHEEIIRKINTFGSIHRHEDNPYVEMSQGIGIESAFINEETQAYEVVCVANNKVEPVYMELNNPPEKNVFCENSDTFKNTVETKNTPSNDLIRNQLRVDVKSPLPDILIASQSKDISKSDSSDADDEGSKDFSLEAAYSRFSLSDNFRPASYYLRSKNILTELQDSSDSEIVSPPPIPTSPPPMDDIEISSIKSLQLKNDESNVTTENNAKECLAERKSTSLMVYGNTPSMYDTIFKGERVKRNRVSLPDNDKMLQQSQNQNTLKRTSLDLKSIAPSYKMSNNCDNDSLLSYNADRGSSRMSIESDISSKFEITMPNDSLQLHESSNSNVSSDLVRLDDGDNFIELRHSHPSSDIEIERMLKRRPLSEESCFEIESLNENLNTESDEVNFDHFLNDLQSESILFPHSNFKNYSKLYKSDSNLKDFSLDRLTVGYLNERVAAIREEVQYENINLNERSIDRCRSRNSSLSNTTSDPDTASTLQTVYSQRRLSNTSIGGLPTIKFDTLNPTRSDSRSSLPIKTDSDANINLQQSWSHTRHASFEQPTISYYTKNTVSSDNDSFLLKNLNSSDSYDESMSKVNISDMTTTKSLKSSEDTVFSEVLQKSNISHSRENSTEQTAPYYYSDLSSQDNLNVFNPQSFIIQSKNNIISNKLNNQRKKAPIAKKSEITHIHNPIHSSSSNNDILEQDDEPNLIAAAARCVSVEFLSAADKIAEIDNKNIYESTSFKNHKIGASSLSLNTQINSKNIYPSTYDKTSQDNINNGAIIQNQDDVRTREYKHMAHRRAVNNYTINRSTISNSNQGRNQPLHNESFNPSSNNLDATLNSSRISNDFQESKNLQSTSKSSNNFENSNRRKRKVKRSDKSNYNGEMMWDEDSLWSENLRRVSHRHARSLDHLDCLANPVNLSGRHSVDLKTMLISAEDVCSINQGEGKPKSTKLTREVKYVNDNVKSQRNVLAKKKHKKQTNSSRVSKTSIDSSNENDVYVQLASNANKETSLRDVLDDGVYEQLAVGTTMDGNTEESSNSGDQFFLLDDDSKSDVRKKFEIDREKLRQWDLMSSGLLKNESSSCAVGVSGGGEAEGGGMNTTITTSASVSMTGTETSTRNTGKLLTTKKPFTGSNPTISRGSTRDISIPVRAVSPRVRSSSAQPWNSQSNFDYETWNTQTSGEDNWSTSKSPSRQSNQPIRAVSPRVRRTTDVEEKSTVSPVSPSIHDPLLGVQKFSAGELLGRTHEELVLLLIQLRRKHTAIANSIEQCCTQIQSVQNRINASEYLEQKHENLQRLEQLKHHLMELEKHYEKSKPLVHLVDNMVKLGSLYNRGPGGSVPSTLERLEYNQIIRERALIEQAAEQRRWAESSENLPREHVEKRIEELRAMERWVAGEANTLRGLRRERESLGGPALQHDLSRVHAMLAENSKKLEQTVAGNARLEQELMVLRQKLQQQQSSNGRSNSFSGESGMDSRAAADATALLEDELKRVQQLVVDLQKQRQELSIAVKQLTDKSQNLVLVSPTSGKQTNDYTNFPKESASKVRHNSVWIETDLDNCTFVEHGGGFNNHMSSTSSASSIKKLAPLYIDTQSINMNYAIENKDSQLSPNACDEPSINPFGNLINVEKQEIKTVRIVKRESERRQRDREKSLQPGNLDWAIQQQNNALDQLVEEESNLSPYHNRSASLPRGYPSNYVQNSYCSTYMQDSQQPSKKYVQNDTLSPTNYQYRSQANPPNTLSLTNVNIPFDNMSISSANSGNKYLSSPSLNNNDYLNGYQDSSMHSYTSKYSYVNHNSSNNSLSQQNVLQSIPYFDNTSETMHPMTNGPLSPDLPKNGSINSLNKCNAELSPVFTSEAAKQIIIEMAGEKNGYAKNSNGSLHRRQVPREKRRHYTAPHHIIVKGLENMADDDIFNQEKWWRARDDVDMERVLRGNGIVGSKHGPPPLVAPPDVVRSTLPSGPLPDHYSEHTIDRLLAAPNKIVIPERYIPEKTPELSPEEQKKRREKVESIKKMLTCTTTPSSDPNKSPDSEDKRQREHLLQLNQLLAKQVMEKSKIVAVKALEKLPIDGESSYDSEDLSPEIELPLYQQRDNFFT